MQVAIGQVRRPLRIAFFGFAASALLVVLQTVVFQILAWDSSAAAKASLALRVAFLAVIEVIIGGLPLIALASGVSLLFASSALARAGEALGDERLVVRARWVQGSAVGAGAVMVGAVLATLSRSTSWNDASTPGGALVVGGLVLAALVATVAVVIRHAVLVTAARAAFLAEIAAAPQPS